MRKARGHSRRKSPGKLHIQRVKTSGGMAAAGEPVTDRQVKGGPIAPRAKECLSPESNRPHPVNDWCRLSLVHE